MNKNTYIVLGVVAVILIAGAAAYSMYGINDSASNSVSNNGNQNQTSIQNSNSSVSSESEFLIRYTDTGYAPGALRVKAGTIVTFKNESSAGMWTASALHPTHAVYPATGGCIASTFDECKADPAGTSWNFKFDIKGEWRYHNHVKPTHFGAIIVE